MPKPSARTVGIAIELSGMDELIDRACCHGDPPDSSLVCVSFTELDVDWAARQKRSLAARPVKNPSAASLRSQNRSMNLGLGPESGAPPAHASSSWVPVIPQLDAP
jgi:hypothetical protein